MTKQIIIDGVDVSECGFFEAFDCYLNPYDNGGCKNRNCDYKRHKRKEQALDEIEKIVEVASEEYRMPEMEWKSILDIIDKTKGQ